MRATHSVANAIWHSESSVPSIARSLLTPVERLYGFVVERRNARYDRAKPQRVVLPALSVGNVTVGGTGKTPMSAWFAQQLRDRGGSPAIVLRGYGDDEWRVHAFLNRGIPVVVAADRIGGLITARTRGADCAVLDDAFQHRRAPRVADVVLLSADQWSNRIRLLPAGPYREPLESLRRATVVVITVKADRSHVADIKRTIATIAPRVPVAVVQLAVGRLHLATSLLVSMSASGDGRTPDRLLSSPVPKPPSHDLGWLGGREIVAASAIGNPDAFEAQLRSAGAHLTRSMRFGDHHRFTSRDALEIARHARDGAGVVCTLKDAVKLASLWPREAPPLWYVSQAVVVDQGADALHGAVTSVLAARAIALTTR